MLRSEHLSSRLRDVSQLQELRDFLKDLGEDVTISLFIRRQDKMMEAAYWTAIKTGATNPFHLEKLLVLSRRYDFPTLVQLDLTIALKTCAQVKDKEI